MSAPPQTNPTRPPRGLTDGLAGHAPKKKPYRKNQSTSKQQTNTSQATFGPAVAGSLKERKT
jgi:hypothetical protein